MKILKNFIKSIIDKDISSGKHKFIRTRFPPEPNGYLHIGHAKSIFLNFQLAKYYNGECYLRFDDTNPSKESLKFVNAIKEDIKWLGFKWNGRVRYTSDYFEKIYSYAIKLIEKDLAYVDRLSPEEIRKYRGTLKSPGINSPYRDTEKKINLSLFKDMRFGKFSEGELCLRAKIDMSSPYIVMRDPVIYRINFQNHYKTKKKWCIYPTYDFAHCISDALEGITHSLCTLEFQDNRRLYKWILKNIEIKHHTKQYEFSRLNLEYYNISKRILKLMVQNNIVKSWDDPRMPTISGLRRKGYTPNSILNFCNNVGVTKKNSNIKISYLESFIRKELNRNAIRLMAVMNPVLIIIENLPDKYEKEIFIYKNPCNIEMGKRKLFLSNKVYIDKKDFRDYYITKNSDYKRLALNQSVRLKYFCNIKVIKVLKDILNNIKAVICKYYIDDNEHKQNKKLGIIHWVSANHNQSAEFRTYDNLFIKNDVKNKNVCKLINHNSLKIEKGFIEKEITLNYKTNIQLEREGYFIIDKESKSDKLIFNKTVSLKN